MLRISRTKDNDLITYVLFSIWDEISDGTLEKKELDVDVEDYWLKIERETELLGVYGFIRNGNSLIAHANILPQHRRQYTVPITKGVSQWLRKNLKKNYHNILVTIPVNRPNVLKYAYSIGFTDKSRILEQSLEDFYKF